ncbi:MAG: valine--tRNA ligase [Anaerolineae bacterium]|nr:valine--tRNA ligase [Anaerolineae bacterium]
MQKLAKRYDPGTSEPRWEQFWQENGVYHFEKGSEAPVYSIDTPPPTVSGHLHLGHVYSYSHVDFIARFWRMRGYNVFYPMGFDDNGLPTDRLVERWEGIRATDVGRAAFIERCIAVSEREEVHYRDLWTRLGLSIDWRYGYRTIDARSRRLAQWSFIDLYRKGLLYRKEAPAIWCPECGISIAQADLEDLERESVFHTVAFTTDTGGVLEIATTRPELLPACVAVFVHPEDDRYRGLVGQKVRAPLFRQWAPVLADPGVDPQKGTGAVMCCTFGDTADVAWWHTHELPLRIAIDRSGRLTRLAGEFAGLSVTDARREIVAALQEAGLHLGERPVAQSVRIHERCDTPVEYVVAPQWFIKVLEFKDDFLAAGAQVHWRPAHMENRFREWVENLNWDWCISRQRYFGVTFPVWYCASCGAVMLADEEALPVDPTTRSPARPCACGSTEFYPEMDTLDTWATSSLTPQIVGQMFDDPELYAQVFPFSLRPQAHEIIRTWAFYTIVKSHHHFASLPWTDAAISGWGLAPEGAGKISKSRGGGPAAPLEMIEKYSADAVRYWTSSTGFGKDALISEEKIQMGAKLVTKLWNVARFAERFLGGYEPPDTAPALSAADGWILSKIQGLIARVTAAFEAYDYASARHDVDDFFWHTLADNYLEMAKLRLYAGDPGARFTLHAVVWVVLKLFAPFFPHVTEEIYQALYAEWEGAISIHRAAWPEVSGPAAGPETEAFGEALVAIAGAVRRFKSEQALALGAEIEQLAVVSGDVDFNARIASAVEDLKSITRARTVAVSAKLPEGAALILDEATFQVAVFAAAMPDELEENATAEEESATVAEEDADSTSEKENHTSEKGE